MKVAHIFVKQKNQRIDKPYSYYVKNEAEIGQRVIVPFGKGNRLLEGIITEIKEKDQNQKLKEVIGYIDDTSLISLNQLKLCNYLKENTFSLFYNSLNNFTAPIKVKKNSKGQFKTYKPKPDYLISLIQIKPVRGIIQNAVIEALKEKSLSFKELKEIVPKVSLKTLIRLKELEIIDYEEIKEEVSDDKNLKKTELKKEFIKLNDLKLFTDLILNNFNNQEQILIIFPNNFLALRFYKYLNQRIDCSFYDPNFNTEENYLFYKKVLNGSIKIIISTYKGLFLNFHSLRAIYLTFTGDENYYANEANHFNVIETAEKLAEIENIPIYFIDFIDSVISNYNLDNQNWKLGRNEISSEFIDINIDHIDLIDENKSVFSKSLLNSIKENFKNNKKTVLVMNRKGYFNYYNCSKCHEPILCPRCGSLLRSVKSGKEVECRLCGFTGKFPDECSICGNNNFNQIQFGIDRVLEEVSKIVPDAKISPYLSNYQGDLNNADIIVGTSQLLYTSKINNVATLGVVLIDIDLNYPDYRSPEAAYRFYSSLFQRYFDSKIIIQTQYFENPFLNALKGDSKKFFQEQQEYRKLAGVPPYSDLYMITLTAKNIKLVNQDIKIFRDRLLSFDKSIEVLKAHALRRIKNVSQKRFLIKNKSGTLRKTLKKMYDTGEIESLNSRVSILVNPSSIL